MTPNTYWNRLTLEQQNDYASRAGTTFLYLQKHIFKKTGKPSRRPGWEIVIGLAEASKRNVSLDESINYFLVNPVKALASEMKKNDLPANPSPSDNIQPASVPASF